MTARRRKQLAALTLLVVGAVILAQLSGVAVRAGSPSARSATLAIVPGGAVTDVTSTKLASMTMRGRAGEVLVMRSTARISVGATGKAKTTQVVCGIRYSRAGDPGWSLGDPYDTVTLRRGQSRTVLVERSFVAPATDRYSISSVCHVAAPARGASVQASGTVRMSSGLPRGAATPVA